MSTEFTRSTRGLIGAALVTLALLVAGCGSSPPASGSKAPSSSGSSGSGGSSSSSGIPQGANAGDADADNHGGPSDGDGNI